MAQSHPSAIKDQCLCFIKICTLRSVGSAYDMAEVTRQV